MTRTQLTYAILATVCWGSYIVAAKVASSAKYCNVPPRWTTLLMSLARLLGDMVLAYEGEVGAGYEPGTLLAGWREGGYIGSAA